MEKKILIIEDNADLSRILSVNIREAGHQVTLAHDGVEGLKNALNFSYDLIVLDLMLPGIQGLEICKELRSRGSGVPILILTSKSSEMDRVLGLELGADDYVTKPFSILELLARIKAMLRRADGYDSTGEASKDPLLIVGDLSMDPERRELVLRGKSVELTAKEFDLLYHFAKNPGRVYSRDQLLDRVWGYNHSGYGHTVNSHINRLRAKIENDPNAPDYILTVWGVGYKFADPVMRLEPRDV